MKTIFFTVSLFVSLCFANAQNEKFYEKITSEYADKEGFSATLIPSDMFELYLKKKSIDEKSPVYNALKNLKSIMIVSQSKIVFPVVVSVNTKNKDGELKTLPEQGTKEDLFRKFSDYYSENKYTLFKTENRMGEDLKVYLKRDQGKTSALALITQTNVSVNLVEIEGNIDLASVAEISKVLNVKGIENLEKINGTGDISVIGYPSPGKSFKTGSDFYNQLMTNMSEEQKKKFDEQMKAMQEKAYQLEEKYRQNPIFLSYPGDSTIYYIDGKKVTKSEMKELAPGEIKTIHIEKPKDKKGASSIKIITK
jgi:hypothetical protein